MPGRLVAILSLILVLTSVGYIETSAQNLVTCPEVVQKAIDAVGNNCGGLSRNSACYGYQSVQAEFNATQAAGYFAAPSDRAQLAEIERLGASPLNEALNQWGIALLSVQANLPDTLPGQNVVFMLMGDSQVENAVKPADTLQSSASASVTAASDADMHQQPSQDAAVVGTLPAGTTATADAVSTDGGWVRVVYNAVPGWVAHDAVSGDLTSLPSIGPDTGTPMQSFYFQSGISGTKCADAPNALVIQGPKNLTVNLRANGADIQLGSTVVLYQIPVDAQTQALLTQQYGSSVGQVSRLLQIGVLDGHVILDVGTDHAVSLTTGETSYRCLSDDENLGNNGQSDDRQVLNTCPWAPPRPMTEGEVEPFRYLQNVSLNYPITLPIQLPPLPEATSEATPENSAGGTPEVASTPEATPTLIPLATSGPASTQSSGGLSVVVMPNKPPVAHDDTAVTDENTSVPIDVLANDTDPESDPLTITDVTAPSHGSTSFGESTTIITYTPDSYYSGPDSFTYSITDGNGSTVSATVNVTVNAVNNAPFAYDDVYFSPPDTPLMISAPGVLGNDYDVEGDLLTASLVPATGPSNGSVTLNGDGSFTYTPNLSFSGSDSFQYTASDGQGGTSNVATVTIEVTTNHPPTAVDDSATTNEQAPVIIDVLANDSDPDSDPLTAFICGNPTFGTVVVNGDNTITYTPNTDFPNISVGSGSGSDTFYYYLQDTSGAYSTGCAAVTVTVNPVNDPPSAADDAYNRLPDTPLTVAGPGVLGNDSDVDNDTLTPSVVTGPVHGTVVLNGDGSFTYTPNSGYNGTDSFTYQDDDGHSGTSGVATVTINVAPNSPPVANDDTFLTPIGTSIPAPGVLGNDTDVDANSLTAALVAGPSHGTLVFNSDGSFSYTPDADFVGDDTFTYKANDGLAFSNVATVTLTRRGTVTTVSVATPKPWPTETPLAPLSDYTYIDPMLRSSVPQPLTDTVFGRMIIRNGVLLPGLNYGYIGNQMLIDMGIIDAMDIFSTVGVTDFGVGVGICMKGRGRLFFLDANFAPRSPRELDWTYVNGYTCGTILDPGIILLVQARGLTATTSGQSCQITTGYLIHLRQGASMDTESLALIPPHTVLTATSRVGDWYAVTYNGLAGYVSARYVANGACKL